MNKSRSSNYRIRHTVILASLVVTTFLFASISAYANNLEDEIKNEISDNPFLDRHGLQLRMKEVKKGYVILMLEQGPQGLIQAIKKGLDVTSDRRIGEDYVSDRALVALRKVVAEISTKEGEPPRVSRRLVGLSQAAMAA